MILRIFGSALTIGMSLWMLCFVCLGYTTAGKDWYGHLASFFFVEDGAPPVMNLAIPILLSGTIATVSMFQHDSTKGVSALPSQLPTCIHRLYHWQRTSSGDIDVKRFTIHFVCWPLALMAIGNMYRHLHDKQLSLDDQLMEIGNTFGFVALVAMSYFLIPVARQSPILKLFQLSPISAVHIHIWSGRIIVIGVALHASFHIYRWKGLAGESILAMIFPPRQCFSLSDNNNFEPECADEDTDCECYDLLRNLTGIIALTGLLIIGITSLNYVRRTNYRLFYLTHVMVAPTVLLITILHYEKAMLYIAPSIIYYIATSFPVMTENRSCCSEEGVKPTRVERIKSSVDRRQRECVSLTLKATPAAVDMLCSGQYIKLGAPQLSSITHPFTVNRVPGSKEELRIIFRVMGKFTNRLCDRLVNPISDALPIITIDGFHGPQNRVDQVLRHDVAVIVAGGIGITPYLSLLDDVHTILASTESRVTKEVVLHWICREQELIDYVFKEYFEPLIAKPDIPGLNIQLLVHRTPSPYVDLGVADDVEAPRESRPVHSMGTAFCPSLYSAGASCSQIHVLIATFTFSTISWVSLWSVMAFYHNNNSEEEIMYRIVSPICVLGVGLSVSWLAKCLFPLETRRDAMSMRLHEGAVFTRVDDGSSSGIDDVLGHQDIMQETKQKKSQQTTVSYEQRDGPRPTVHSLLKHLDSVRCPGLFMCGPVSLMDNLRSAAQDRCSIRRCQCIAGDPNIAVYEEHFEM